MSEYRAKEVPIIQLSEVSANSHLPCYVVEEKIYHYCVPGAWSTGNGLTHPKAYTLANVYLLQTSVGWTVSGEVIHAGGNPAFVAWPNFGWNPQRGVTSNPEYPMNRHITTLPHAYKPGVQQGYIAGATTYTGTEAITTQHNTNWVTISGSK